MWDNQVTQTTAGNYREFEQILVELFGYFDHLRQRSDNWNQSYVTLIGLKGHLIRINNHPVIHGHWNYHCFLI